MPQLASRQMQTRLLTCSRLELVHHSQRWAGDSFGPRWSSNDTCKMDMLHVGGFLHK